MLSLGAPLSGRLEYVDSETLVQQADCGLLLHSVASGRQVPPLLCPVTLRYPAVSAYTHQPRALNALAGPLRQQLR